MYTYILKAKPFRHQWHITLHFYHTSGEANLLQLANWVAGSYMIRDFSRHIMSIQATHNGKIVAINQLNKNTWQLPNEAGNYQIDYVVYANDLSVRASFLDNERGFFDGTSLFLYQPNHQDQPAQIIFQDLPENWQIQTTLPQISANTFQAANYAQLVDNPFELGANIEVLYFNACGITHRIALSGHYPDFDRQRLITDCQKICKYEIELFPRPTPFNEYLFLLHLGDHIYGGLEHRNSTALHADRNALPPQNMGEANTAYTELLGLIAHEYFHAWNIKSIKPKLFQPYDLTKEIHTEQLWAYEGITSYYDDLTLVRSGVISTESYLNTIAQNITRVYRNAGRKQQTLSQSSFSAWHKYYKQDENSPNAITSYYQQGALMAMCLDLIIREKSQYSLDFVMQQLYARYQATGEGTAEQEWQQLAQSFTQLDLQDFFQAALYTTNDLPLESCLKSAGIELKWLPANSSHKGRLVNEFSSTIPQPELGCRFRQQNDGAVLTHVLTDSSAENAGLKAGDKIIAINHFACTDLTAQAQTHVGDTHTLHYFRHGVLHQTQLTVQAANATCAELKIVNQTLLEQWLFN